MLLNRNFIRYSVASNFILSIENMLSTHSILCSVGINTTEMVLSTSLVTKDIIGQLGGLVCINKIGPYIDKNPKVFSRYINALQQGSIITECISPLLPGWSFIPVAGLANIGKNISFTGLGAINTKCIQKISATENFGETYARLCTINIQGSTLGTIVGLGIIALIPDHTTRLLILPILGWLRWYTFKKSIEGLY